MSQFDQEVQQDRPTLPRAINGLSTFFGVGTASSAAARYAPPLSGPLSSCQGTACAVSASPFMGPISNSFIGACVYTSSSNGTGGYLFAQALQVGRGIAHPFGPASPLTTSPTNKNSQHCGNNPALVLSNTSGGNAQVVCAFDYDGNLFYMGGILSTSENGSLSFNWPNGAKNFANESGNKPGSDPALALNVNGTIVAAVNQSQTASNPGTIAYYAGSLKSSCPVWTQTAVAVSLYGIQFTGTSPAIAINANNLVCLTFVNTSSELQYLLGTLNPANNSITWTSQHTFASGYAPSVFLTNDNYVYVAYTSEARADASALLQCIGQVQFQEGNLLNPLSITFNNWLGQSFANDGFVPASQNSSGGSQAPAYRFSVGAMPSIACNAAMTTNTSSLNLQPLQVHVARRSEPAPGAPFAYVTTHYLVGSSSIIFNHANWMGQNWSTVQGLTLARLCVPGSHDAAMYPSGGVKSWGQTQDLTLYAQLNAGVRYFDLRPELQGSGTNPGKFILHHDVIDGPALDDVLADIAAFLTTQSGEFVVLKFSHYAGSFNYDVLYEMCQQIKKVLGKWLITSVPAGKRLATVPLGQLPPANQPVSSTLSRVLVLCDAGEADGTTFWINMPNAQAITGFWNIRDWNASKPSQGDVTMFDLWSDAVRLGDMVDSNKPDKYINATTLPAGEYVPRGQTLKFWGYSPSSGSQPSWPAFAGKCQNGRTPCDLFLLSWTLTTTPNVWAGAVDANASLMPVLFMSPQYAGSNSELLQNGNNYHVNILYTDYVQYARSTDLAYLANDLLPS
jgi:hypothetical protein